MPTKRLVETDDLEALLAALASAGRVAVDTEFMRERTYFAQLCLVQIATPPGIFFVDPLQERDLAEVWDTLLRCDWILHSGRQDIEVVYQSTGRMPQTLFDTQIAAALVGCAPQIGYANLISELFGETLAKSHTRADWSRRPLTDAMLRYAADDVAYLLEACDELTERLRNLGRVDWAIEDSAALLDKSLYDIDLDGAIDKVKGARRLRGRPRRAAAGLARWREQRALDSDRPRRWILKDAVLLDIAQTNPRTERELADIEGLPASTARRSAGDLLRILSQSADESAGADDDHEPPSPLDEEQKACLRRVQAEVSRCADELGVSAEIIAPRKELAAFVMGARESRMLSGWRRDIVGERLLTLLA